MPVRPPRPFISIIVPLLVFTPALSHEEVNSAAPEPPRGSVQQQLDELKAGQQQLRKELEDIKHFLQERSMRTNTVNKPAVPAVDSVNVRGEPFRGTHAAGVAIIEYSDFDCSFCGRYAREIYPRVDRDYVKPGKLRYFFRDLPESKETNSWFRARAARCAGDQGKFWELHDLLFNAQSGSQQDVISLAQALGLNTEVFNECLSGGKYLVNIENSVAGAKRMGIYGTPAFLIGAMSEDGDFVKVKRVLVGAESYESIKTILDELLASASSN